MTGAPVQCKIEGRLARITLCRSRQGNPLDPDLVQSLRAAVVQAREADVSVVVLVADGPTFCVGGDIAQFAASADPAAFVAALADGVHDVISALARMPAIVVTVVRGMAAGAGVPLAAAGDIVLAAESARFTLAYTKLGLSPDGASTMLPASVGLHRSLHLALLNPVLTAEQMREIGLVAQVHPDEELDTAVEVVLGSLLAASRGGQLAAKRLLRAQASSSLENAMQAEADSISRLAGSPDGREGVAAFMTKRRPAFPTHV